MYEFAKWLLASMGLVLLIGWTIGGVLKFQATKKRRTAIATGTVLRYRSRRFFSRFPSPEIEFVNSRGEQITFLSKVSVSWHSWPIGSNVKVFYDPNDPADAEIKPTFDIILLGLIVAVGFAIPVGMAAYQWLTK